MRVARHARRRTDNDNDTDTDVRAAVDAANRQPARGADDDAVGRPAESECAITHMGTVKLSTADLRRAAVADAAIDEFAKTGYHGTPITNVAARARISPAYVFKLFPGRVSLFVAAVDRTFELVEEALAGVRSPRVMPIPMPSSTGWAARTRS